MNRVLASIIIFLLPCVVAAQQDYPRDLTLSWTNPSEYENGDPILEGDLRAILATCWRNNDPNTLVVEEEVPINPVVGSEQTHTFVGSISQPGTYLCVAYAVTSTDIYSDPSNTKAFRFIGKPKPVIIK